MMILLTFRRNICTALALIFFIGISGCAATKHQTVIISREKPPPRSTTQRYRRRFARPGRGNHARRGPTDIALPLGSARWHGRFLRRAATPPAVTPPYSGFPACATCGKPLGKRSCNSRSVSPPRSSPPTSPIWERRSAPSTAPVRITYISTLWMGISCRTSPSALGSPRPCARTVKKSLTCI